MLDLRQHASSGMTVSEHLPMPIAVIERAAIMIFLKSRAMRLETRPSYV